MATIPFSVACASNPFEAYCVQRPRLLPRDVLGVRAVAELLRDTERLLAELREELGAGERTLD
jgi:hypothetical protein